MFSKKSENQNAVLRYLGVGDSFHTAKHGVEKYNGHPDKHSGGYLHLEKAGEHNANTSHLPRHVSERDKQNAHHGDHPGDV